MSTNQTELQSFVDHSLRGMALLDRVMEVVEAHPENWDQDRWSSHVDPDEEETAAVIVSDGVAYVPMTCSTTFCIAGWAATIAGGKWADDDMMVFDPTVDGELPDVEDLYVEGRRSDGAWDSVEVQAVRCSTRAQNLLDIDDNEAEELFDGGNSIERVREVVADIKAARGL